MDLLVKNNVKIRKIDEFSYVIDKEESKGMRVPVTSNRSINLKFKSHPNHDDFCAVQLFLFLLMQ